MKKILGALGLALLLAALSAAALADRMYLIPDSNTRRLTEDELWDWDRESLGFIFNEILARHGYVFSAGGKFDIWFSAMPWYHRNADPNNERACLPKLSQLEWDNYHIVKRVSDKMKSYGMSMHDASKKCYRRYTPPRNDFALSGFSYADLKGAQKLNVYSAPGTDSWRGANGKAQVSTNGGVWAAGWEGNWLLIYYETNNGSIRVGYVDGRQIRGGGSTWAQLQFSRDPVQLLANCTLTDDPMKSNTTMASLRAGTQVTYLTSFINQYGQIWDYIETFIGGRRARGFIAANCIDYPEDAAYDPVSDPAYEPETESFPDWGEVG